MAAFPDLQAPLRSSRFRDRHWNRRSEAWELTNTDSKSNRLSRVDKANRNHRLVQRRVASSRIMDITDNLAVEQAATQVGARLGLYWRRWMHSGSSRRHPAAAEAPSAL